MIATTTVTTLYVKIKEDATECSFKSFEVTTTIYPKNRLEMLVSYLSQNTWMSLKQTIEKKPNFELNNWNIVEVPVTYKLSKQYKTLVP